LDHVENDPQCACPSPSFATTLNVKRTTPAIPTELTMRSPKLQRLTSMAVPALLAANAMVLVLGLATYDSDPAGADTVTYIQSPDGTLTAVDPSTPEGWKAIAEAEQRGQEVVTVPVEDAPAGLTTTTVAGTPPAAQAGTSGITVPGQVGDLLHSTESTIVGTVDQLGNTVDGAVDGVTDLVDGTTGLDTGGTVDPAVDGATDTLTTTVSTVLDTGNSTVTTVVDTVNDVVNTVVNPTTTTAAPTTTTTAAPVVTVPQTVPVVGGTEVTVPTTLPGL
jgi:hypothetical protein